MKNKIRLVGLLIVLFVGVVSSMFVFPTDAQQKEPVGFTVDINKSYYLGEEGIIVKVNSKNVRTQLFTLQVKGIFFNEDITTEEFVYDGTKPHAKAVKVVKNGSLTEYVVDEDEEARRLKLNQDEMEFDIPKLFDSRLGAGKYKLSVSFDKKVEKKNFEVVFDRKKSTPLLVSSLKSKHWAEQIWGYANLAKFNETLLTTTLQELRTSDDKKTRDRASNFLYELDLQKKRDEKKKKSN